MKPELQKRLAELRKQYPAASFNWIWNKVSLSASSPDDAEIQIVQGGFASR